MDAMHASRRKCSIVENLRLKDAVCWRLLRGLLEKEAVCNGCFSGGGGAALYGPGSFSDQEVFTVPTVFAEDMERIESCAGRPTGAAGLAPFGVDFGVGVDADI